MKFPSIAASALLRQPKARRPKQRVRGPSALEEEFATRWAQLYPALRLERELHFHPKRKWRFDFSHSASKVAVEIEGGIYTSGRHTRGKGFEGDCKKINAAQSLGWIVFRLSPAMLRDGEQLALVARAIEERACAPELHNSG